MKKILRTFLIVMLLIPFGVLALEKEYDLSTTYNIKFSISSDYETIIKGYDNSIECDNLGIDEEQILNYMETRDAYVLASTQDLQKNIIFTRNQDEYTKDYYDLTNIDNDVVNALADGFKKGFNADGYDIEKINNITYMKFKYDIVSVQDEHLYYLKYKTFYNGYDYTFYIQKYSEITNDDETELKNIINNIIIKEIKNSNSYSSVTNPAVYSIIALIVFIAFWLLFKIIKKNKEKKVSDKDSIQEIKTNKNIKTEEPKKEKEPNKVEVTEKKEVVKEKNEEKIKEDLFKCDNCGAIVKGSAKKCPECGEKFEDESDNSDDMDKKYSDLNKLKKLLDDKIITKEEFDKEKKKVLNR